MMQPIFQKFQVPFGYPVYFTSRLFCPDNPVFKEALSSGGGPPEGKILFIVDRGMAAHHPGLAAGIEAYCRENDLPSVSPPLVVDGGEGVKNDPVFLGKVYAAIEAEGLCRHSYLAAIGGGAVLDMVGYAAATAHRGIRLIRIPTTTLSQDDSGIGVKNGMNAFGRKNFLGTFHPPFAVLNDSDFLITLSTRDWRSGISEAIKVALIKDRMFFEFMEAEAGRLVRREMPPMQEVIVRSAGLHLRHIAAHGDPFELGSSRPLDFGHWSAHKLEQLTHYRIRHGEAVAVGMALDTTYSYLAGFLSGSDWERVLRLLSTIGFTLYLPELEAHLDRREDLRCLLNGLTEFREHLGGALTIMLLRKIGEGIEVNRIDEALFVDSIALLKRRAGSFVVPVSA